MEKHHKRLEEGNQHHSFHQMRLNWLVMKEVVVGVVWIDCEGCLPTICLGEIKSQHLVEEQPLTSSLQFSCLLLSWLFDSSMMNILVEVFLLLLLLISMLMLILLMLVVGVVVVVQVLGVRDEVMLRTLVP